MTKEQIQKRMDELLKKAINNIEWKVALDYGLSEEEHAEYYRLQDQLSST